MKPEEVEPSTMKILQEAGLSDDLDNEWKPAQSRREQGKTTSIEDLDGLEEDYRKPAAADTFATRRTSPRKSVRSEDEEIPALIASSMSSSDKSSLDKLSPQSEDNTETDDDNEVVVVIGVPGKPVTRIQYPLSSRNVDRFLTKQTLLYSKMFDILHAT